MPNPVANVAIQVSPYRMFYHAPCFKTRVFDTEQLFYAIRDSYFAGAYRHYVSYFPGATDTEETREQVLVSLARGLFMADCGGNA